MNAPETLKPATDPINIAHEVLMKSDEALCVDEVARAIFCVDKPKKADLRDAGRMLKELADLGMIEMEPRAGGVPFYRLIAAPAVGDSEGGETDAPAWASDPALQYLAPEDYEMPQADPALLAMANRELSHQLSHIATTCAEYLPDPSDITTVRAVEIMDMLINAQQGYIRVLEDRASVAASLFDHLKGSQLERDDLRDRLHQQIEQWQADTGRLTADLRASMESRSQAINEADRLRAELAAERQAREALQEQSGVIQAAGYVLKAPKRLWRSCRNESSAKSIAMAAARRGIRIKAFALVPIGEANPGAEWRDA